jgi:membrane protease YdiL (CAAX protease family)
MAFARRTRQGGTGLRTSAVIVRYSLGRGCSLVDKRDDSGVLIDTGHMPFSFAIVALVLIWTWLLASRVPDRAALAVGAAVVALAVWHNVRHGEWGVRWRALGGASRGAILVTLPGVALILAAGWALGTLHDRRDVLSSVGPLVVWGAAQQWVLQTVFLREAQRATSRRGGIVVAAALFGLLHLPNPFLTGVTIAGALFWCAIYDRYPNVVPLAVSQGLGTLALRYAFDAETLGRLRVGYSYLLLGGP